MTSSRAVAPNVPAFSPAASTSYASAIRFAYRVSSATCCGVSAVPSDATTFSKPGLVRHERVRVALDDHGLAGLADRGLRAVDEVQRPALVEQRRRRGVEVLRPVVDAVLADALLAQHAAAEPHRVAVRVPDREDDPLPEPVVHAAAALARAGEAHLQQLARRDLALRRQLAGHLCPSRRGAQPSWNFSIVSSVKPAAPQVRERRLARLRLHQDRVVEGDRGLQHLAQPRVAGVLALGPLVDLHAGPPGQHPGAPRGTRARRAPSRT